MSCPNCEVPGRQILPSTAASTPILLGIWSESRRVPVAGLKGGRLKDKPRPYCCLWLKTGSETVPDTLAGNIFKVRLLLLMFARLSCCRRLT